MFSGGLDEAFLTLSKELQSDMKIFGQKVSVACELGFGIGDECSTQFVPNLSLCIFIQEKLFF